MSMLLEPDTRGNVRIDPGSNIAQRRRCGPGAGLGTSGG
jgi:hypothetical protein